ncbi:kynurenine 3-monooxygenase [Cylas formicarius]|uniref:kynurenine 3-monooxygenase n=1 Tax=Cylas formicarius TaxID=197179 RepID=UPI0029583ED8|nr:kynurenine 3-monooxygenase [Cylas formicarius]
MDGTRSKNKVIVVGGGLVGALCVCFMAKRGYDVFMYEKREDMRKIIVERGRSINLALSHRGRRALRHVGLEDEILSNAVPMLGRYLHKLNCRNDYVPYDPVANQCIYSVNRNFLNQVLLNAAQAHGNVKLFFKHKMTKVDFASSTITITNLDTGEIKTESADLVVGADGAFSVLRQHMQLTPMFDMSQAYIEHGYMELCIPTERGTNLKPNCLHIWPRGEFMMIALPNQDTSWTVTLFMPFEKFESVISEDDVLSFFEANFPDSVSAIGERALVDTFLGSKPSSLVSIKCNRYHAGDGFLIVGDAAHAMVPFYGQGMNAGFEDCSILHEILDETEDNIPKSIKDFSSRRRTDAHAVCDLAMYNYIEMRDLVTRPTYRLRRMLDCFLERLFPGSWTPLYNSISFGHTRYSQCVRNRQWQDKILKVGLASCVLLATLIIVFL